MQALILVDIQRDFLPGGPLGVAEGDQIIPVANRLQPQFTQVIATQDWHPADHGSFAANHPGHAPGEVIDLDGLPQILWPIHCLQGSAGAALADALDQRHLSATFAKGTDPHIDSYSAFFDNGHRKATGLGQYLKEKGIHDVYILGLAADVCVKFTALDAVGEGFQTYVITDGTRGVNLQPGDTERAFADLRQAGVHLIESEDVVSAG
jgi:nicotinamidase/pyrazinamidase